jgi:hypothetical protein
LACGGRLSLHKNVGYFQYNGGGDTRPTADKSNCSQGLSPPTNQFVK